MEYGYDVKCGYVGRKDDGSKVLYPTEDEYYEALKEEREKNKD